MKPGTPGRFVAPVNIADFGNASRLREQISYDACVASHGSVIAVWFTDVH